MNTITMQHEQKENRQKPRVSAGFVSGAEGLVSAVASVGPGRSPPGCRPPRHALRRGAAVPRCRVLPRSNEKSQASRKRYLTFLAGAEGLGLRSRSGRLVACVPLARTRPSARGFGVDVGKRTGGTGEGQCCPVSNASPGEDGAGLVLWEIFRAKTGEKEREIPEKT